MSQTQSVYFELGPMLDNRGTKLNWFHFVQMLFIHLAYIY